MAVIEEFVVWGRKSEFVADEGLLGELKRRGFEPQVVGEIDPPPKNGGSWVLRDKRDRRSHEDGGVWVAWTRPRGNDRRSDATTKYVIETFDGRSGYDWFLSVALAQVISAAAKGMVSADGGPDTEAAAFASEMSKDPTNRFDGPESVVDWESANLSENYEDSDDEDDDEDDDDEDAAGAGGEDDDEDDEDADEDEDDDDDDDGEEEEDDDEDDE